MDKWFDDQIKKMKLGGNAEWREFYEASPEYSPNMTLKEKYHSGFATAYREKLAAKCEGRKWTPSTTTTTSSSRTTNRISTSGTTNKNNASSNRSSPSRSASSSYQSNGPVSNLNGSNSSSGGGGGRSSEKVRNEAYFETLGRENESRPENLPPSQGGKYTGFGNPAFTNQSTPASSNSAPDLDELINDPVSALTKGFSFLGYQVVEGAKLAAQGAETLGQTVNDRVIKPTTEKVRDPEFSQQVAGYVAGISKTVAETASRGISTISSNLPAVPSPSGVTYSRSNYSSFSDTTSSSQSVIYDNSDNDFFADTINHYQQQRNSPNGGSRSNSPALQNNSTRSASPKLSSTSSSTTRRREGKKDEKWDNEWNKW